MRYAPQATCVFSPSYNAISLQQMARPNEPTGNVRLLHQQRHLQESTHNTTEISPGDSSSILCLMPSKTYCILPAFLDSPPWRSESGSPILSTFPSLIPFVLTFVNAGVAQLETRWICCEVYSLPIPLGCLYYRTFYQFKQHAVLPEIEPCSPYEGTVYNKVWSSAEQSFWHHTYPVRTTMQMLCTTQQDYFVG